MSLPEFWIVAGIKGAGKTTFAQKAPIRNLLQDVEVLNTDDLTLRLLRDDGVPEFAARVDRLFVFDDSDDDPERPARLIAQASDGVVVVHDPGAVPDLTRCLLAAGATLDPSPS